MDLGLKGKTALVTAASRGFGREVARQLAAEGARVGLCARGAEDLSVAAEEVREAGQGVWDDTAGKVLARPVDVRDAEAMDAFIGRVEKELGPIDLLLVNAGGPRAGRFFDLDDTAWQEAFELSLASATRLCRRVLPGMMERKWGRIVQITSVSVVQPVDNLMLSSVIRPAAHALIKVLAQEAAPHGVTVNSVAPGFHDTSRVQDLIRQQVEQGGGSEAEVLESWTRAIPAGRLGKPEELAGLILFLMSEKAGYITGQGIVSDGGWVQKTF